MTLRFNFYTFFICFLLFVSSCVSKQPNKRKLQKTVVINRPYLNIPLVHGSSKRHMILKVDTFLLGDFLLPLANEKPDYYGFVDLSHCYGKQLTMELDSLYNVFSNITLDDEIKGSKDLYKEKYRPQLHFTTKRGWINDPNGLIYYKGLYHLYYQYNPFDTKWGNISWGHAVSKDLVHWEEKPAVLYPNHETGMCWSGAAFIDRKNQLGLKTGAEDVILAFYLRTKIGLSLAYSNDAGQTFTDFNQNPVLSHNGERIDTPRPFWFEPTKKWIAPTYDFFTNEEGEKRRCVGFYSSDNLRNWTLESRVKQDSWGDELCGCVDFFQLPVNGNVDEMKWVMIFIDGSYIVGTFDGKTFYTLDGTPASTHDRNESLVIDGNYYATMTWHNMPNNRRVQVTWMKYWNEPFEKGPKTYSDMPFNQQFTLPSELTLHKNRDGYYLKINPVEELKSLRTNRFSMDNQIVPTSHNILADLQHDVYEIDIELLPGKESTITVDIRGLKLIYDAPKEKLSLGELETKLTTEDGSIKLQLFVDRTSVEVYANGGKVYLPVINFISEDSVHYAITDSQGTSKIRNLKVYELRSIWDTVDAQSHFLSESEVR